MTLTRIIHKTPLANEKTNVYEVEFDSNLVKQVLQSRFIGEGVYCLEQYSIDDYNERYLITPSFDKQFGSVTEKDWNFKSDNMSDLTIYELILEKPVFMPLDVKQFVDLFHTEYKESVFMQVLTCKRLDNWREVAIQQYESYLSGSDSPLESKFAIKFQDKVLNVLNKISNYTVKRNNIEEMEQKILSHNYRFECRFIIYDEKHANFLSKMEKNLKKLQLFNEFRLKKVQNKRNMLKLIENREFKVDLVNQLLSESEIYSLLCDKAPTGIQKVEIEKPVKQQSVLKNLEDSMLLQRAVQLMPKGEVRNVEIDQTKAEQINQAFKRVNIIKKSMKVTEMHQGSSLLKVQMEIPPDITYTSVSKKLVDIQAALGNQNVSVEIGDKPDTINIFVPLENRGVVYFRDILESEEFQQHKKKYPLPFIIGESVNGELLFSCLAELRHLLVTGATGSGKSVFVNLLLMSLLLNVPPDELSMYLIDPKQVEYSMFKGFPQVRKIVTNMKVADGLLNQLVIEMERRYDLFSNSGVKNITSYNKNHEVKLPFIVCAIDEYADLVMVNSSVEDHLVRLGQKARAAGIHLIICTQKPLADIVTSVLKSNLPSAISFRLKTSSDYQTVFGKGIPYNLLGKGDGVAKLEGQLKEYERFQSPVLTLVEEDEEEIYSQLKEMFHDVDIVEEELPEPESDRDKLKRIIAETNELRVSELGRLMSIGNNKIHALMIELLSEGWLKKEGRSYEVNVDEEELNKWRDKE
jgi:DNA segregation ATPase FtsK/SpoIIIE, S-DNA-T family